MIVSLNWIKDFVALDDDMDPAEVLDRITMSTAEVEEVMSVGAHFTQVVTARVTEVRAHPNADNLKLVRVNDGIMEMEVICGAPNVELDQVVALAKAGADLPGGKLKASTIRGVRSEGMLCAEDELGLSEDHSGILVFSDDMDIGTSLDKIYGPPDIVLEIDNKSLTHRPDLWGHLGMAREFSAVYHKPFVHEQDENVLLSREKKDPLEIDNRAPDLCPRYSALVLRNVSVKPSPEWMQQRLWSVGIRPINNLVDVTNYVMLELGQPMHAFDRREIKGDVIVIRRAHNNEKFITLDKQEHTLLSEDLVIADAQKSVALGGVMGGLNSEIQDDTSCIVLESANFHSTAIRRTATRLQLRTDSAQRFEKSQDPYNTHPSIVRAVELIRLTCPDAMADSEFLDSFPSPPDPIDISIDFDFINRRLGERLPEEQIVDILKSLSFGVRRIGENELVIRVPSYRATKDVSMSADIVEEIGRIYGYDNITPIAPNVLSDPPEVNHMRQLEWESRDLICGGMGFEEVANYSFISKDLLKRCGFDHKQCLHLLNPISHDYNMMRPTLVPHIVNNVAKNMRHLESGRLFEIGRATQPKKRHDPALAEENRRLTGAVWGEGDTPFFIVKGVVEAYMGLLQAPELEFRPPEACPKWAHPARSSEVFCANRSIGIVAELHPGVADDFEIRGHVGMFDLDFDTIFELPRGDKSFTPLRRYPVNPIEITVVVDGRLPVEEIAQVIRKVGGKLLVEYKFLYIYVGEPLKEGQKAVTYHVVFGADDRTLSSKEVADCHEKLVTALAMAGMPLRGSE